MPCKYNIFVEFLLYKYHNVLHETIGYLMVKSMYKKIVFFAVVLLLSCASEAQVQAGPASGSYEITSSVLSGGGGRAESASYGLEAVVSQPSALHPQETVITSESYQLMPGFLATVGGGATCADFDVEPDGDIDGADLSELAASEPSPVGVENFARLFGMENCLPAPPDEEGYY